MINPKKCVNNNSNKKEVRFNSNCIFKIGFSVTYFNDWACKKTSEQCPHYQDTSLYNHRDIL